MADFTPEQYAAVGMQPPEPEPAEEAAGTPLTFRSTLDSIVSDESFYQQPYEDQLHAVRQVYFGEDLSGNIDWEEEDKVRETYRDAVDAVRQYNERKIAPEDWIDLTGRGPDIGAAESPEQAAAMLDQWEGTAIARLKTQHPREYLEFGDIVEQQIKEKVDSTKQRLFAEEKYPEPIDTESTGGKFELAAESTKTFTKGAITPMVEAAGWLGEQLGALEPGSAEHWARAIKTSKILTEPPEIFEDPEYLKETGRQKVGWRIPGLKDPVLLENIASGLGSTVGVLAPGALLAPASIPAAVVGSMSTAARMGYREGYDQVFSKSQDRRAAVDAAWINAGVEAADGAFDFAVAGGLIPFLKLGKEAKRKLLTDLTLKGAFGKVMAAGLRYPARLAEKAIDVAGMSGASAISEMLQETTQAWGNVIATGDWSFAPTKAELITAGIVGGVGGGGSHVAGETIRDFRAAGIPFESVADLEPAAETKAAKGETRAAPGGTVAPETETKPTKPETPAETILEEPPAPAAAAKSARPIDLAERGQIEEGTDTTLTGKKYKFKRELVDPQSLVMQKDIPNVKKGADPETGLVGDPEKFGTFSPASAGNVLVLEKDVTAGGEREVMSGRNRTAAAQLQGVEKIGAIVIKESEGFTIDDAKLLDAEMNIRDNRGETEDYVEVFQKHKVPLETAQERGLLRNEDDVGGKTTDPGMRGYFIGTYGTPDLITGFKKGDINERQAAAIAYAAPNDAQLQREGIAAAQAGDSPDMIADAIEVAKIARTMPQESQPDLFGEQGRVDTRELAAAAGELRKETNALIAKYGSSKRVAAIEGEIPGIEGKVNVANPVAFRNALKILQERKRKLKVGSWSKFPDIKAEIQARAEQRAKEGNRQIGLNLNQPEVLGSPNKGRIVYNNKTKRNEYLNTGEPVRAEPEDVDEIEGIEQSNREQDLKFANFTQEQKEQYTRDFIKREPEIAAKLAKVVRGQNAPPPAIEEAVEEDIDDAEILGSPEFAPKNYQRKVGATTPPGRGASERSIREHNAALEKSKQDVLAAPSLPNSPQTMVDPVYGASNPIPPGIYGSTPPAAQTAPTGIEGISAPEVINALADIVEAAGMDTPIREATERGRGRQGAFYVQPEVIRTKQANDIPTAAHEVAHAIEKGLWGKKNPWAGVGVNAQRRAELTKLGRNLYGSSVPHGGYMREGWAQFVRFWITGEEDVSKSAPENFKWFTNTFLPANPDVAAAIESAKQKAGRFFSQSARQRAAHSIVPNSTMYSRMREALDIPFRRRVSEVTKAFVESGEALFELQQVAREKAGKQGVVLDRTDEPYAIFDALRMTHIEKARYMVDQGMLDYAGNKIGGSLKDAFAVARKGAEKLKVDPSEFISYLWAKRAIALWNDPQRAARNPGLSLPDAESIFTELTNPDWEMASSKIYEWQEGVLNYISQASPELAEIVGKIRAVDPGFYIPLQREFHKLNNMWDRAEKRSVNQKIGSPLKRLRGSGRRILNPVDSMLRSTEQILLAGHKRAVLDSVLNLQKVEGLGHLITEIPRQMVPAASQNLADVLRTMESTLKKNGIDGTVTAFDQAGGPIDMDTLEQMMAVFFAPAVKAPNGEVAHLTATVNGQQKFYEIDADLLDALTGMDMYRANNFFSKWFLQVPNQWFKLGTTGLRFRFAFVTNPARDIQTAVINSQGKASVPAYLYSWGKMLMSSTLSSPLFNNRLINTGYQDPYIDLARRLGATMGQPLDQMASLSRTRNSLVDGKFRIMDAGGNAYEFLAELFQIPETATRATELKTVMADMGIAPTDQLTPEQARDLTLAFKQVTVDFSAAGEISRKWNMALPFFNAGIQGPRSHVRAIQKNPKRVALIALSLVGLAMANWWKNKDEEWWKELKDTEKYLFTWIPFDNPFTGQRDIIRLPRPFEFGGITQALTESILDSSYQSNPEMIYQWINNFWKTTSPVDFQGMQPVLLNELIDQLWGAGGYDQFWERPIVPYGETFSPPEQQFNEHTSETAKKLGEWFGWSPRRIDHAIKGVFGQAASDVVEAGETLSGLRAGRPERLGETTGSDVADFMISPFKAALLRSESDILSNATSVDKFYNSFQEAQLYRKREDTELSKKISSSMNAIQKSLSVLRDFRLQAKTLEDRKRIERQMLELARQGNKIWETKNPAAVGGLKYQAKTLQKQRKTRSAATLPSSELQ